MIATNGFVFDVFCLWRYADDEASSETHMCGARANHDYWLSRRSSNYI